ncbi:MAG: endonuclease NucS [Candidatus Methanomethylicia archaeon]
MEYTSSLKFLHMPNFMDAEKLLKEGLENRRMIILIGSCIVDYIGRASSTLTRGERLIIVKSDGSIQIHRPKDVSPVNWQPPGCIFHVESTENELCFKAIRSKPREYVNIIFDSITFIACFNLYDEGEFSLYASELDMQKAIIASPSIIEDGLKIISFERHVDPGFIDLYGIDSKGRLVILEIKRRIADKSAVLQLAKYVDEVKGRSPYREVRGILVAPGLAKGVQTLLSSLGLEFKRLDPKKCAEILSRSSEGIDLKKFIKS